MSTSDYSPPMYLQVKDLLLKKITNGEFTQGSKLPSESELSVQYGISRMTACHALTELVREEWPSGAMDRGTSYHILKSKETF